MAKRIKITAGEIEAEAQLNDTGTAKAIWEKLRLRGHVNLWGDEVYFSVPLSLELEAGQEVVGTGDLGYWPEGNAFCIFFGPTPVSQSGEIRAASQVTIFGKIIGDATVFRAISTGTEINISRKE